MNATTLVKLEGLTAHLTCNLCRGYLVDATTIIECLHSYCKSCIVVHLESSEYCPVCDVQLQPSRPLESVRSDKVLQEMVYKLVPGLYAREMERQRQYYAAHPEKVPAKVKEVKQNCYITSNDEMQLSYEPVVSNDPNEEAGQTFRRYIKCKAGASISVVKKLIAQKFGLNKNAVLDVMYGDRLIPDDFLLMDVAYKYSWNQKNESHLPLKYKVHGDPKFFETKTAPLISSDGAVEALKLLKYQARLKLNGIAKKKPDGLGPIKSKKILQESVKSQLVLNESHQLVNVGKLPLDARIPKKGRPPKNKPSGTHALKQQLPQNSSIHPQPKEVQLSISEKGIMSATVPVTAAYNSSNSKASDGAFSFPRVEPVAISCALQRGKPQSSMISRAVCTPKQQSQVGMPQLQLPNEMTVRTTTWHPKVPKETTSHQEQELAVKALKKKKTPTNMETLKGVNRKLQNKLPDHYYKADIVPLSSPPANTTHSTNGIKPKSGTNGKISPSKKQVFNLGEVRFTPVIAKKLLSSPGSKLQLDDSPKRHKIFKSRQLESSTSNKPANQTFPPLNGSSEEPEELPDLNSSFQSHELTPAIAQEPSVSTPFVTLPAPQAPVSISVSAVNGMPAFFANHFNSQLFNLRQNLACLPNFNMYGQNSSTCSPDFLRSLSKMAQDQQHQPAFLSQMLAHTNISGLPIPMYTAPSLQSTVASHSAGMNHTTFNPQLPLQHSSNKRTVQMVVTNGHHTSDVSQFSDKSLLESERRVSDDLARLTAMVTTVSSESEVPTKRRKSSSPSKLRRLLTAPNSSPKQKVNGFQGTPSLNATVTMSTCEDSTTTNEGFYVRNQASIAPDAEVPAHIKEVPEEPQAVSEPPLAITDTEDGLEGEDKANSFDGNDTEMEQSDVLPTDEGTEQTEDSSVELETEETEKEVPQNEIALETSELGTVDQPDAVVSENAPDEPEEPEEMSKSPVVIEDECDDDDDDNVLHIVEEKAEVDQTEESSNIVEYTTQVQPQTPPSTAQVELEAALPTGGDVENTTEDDQEETLPTVEAEVEDDVVQPKPNINNNEIDPATPEKELAISSPNEISICQTQEPDAIISTATSA